MRIRKSEPIRVDTLFSNEMRDIINSRVKIGKDKPMEIKPTSRITRAIVNHSQWDKIKKDICLADLPDLEEEERR